MNLYSWPIGFANGKKGHILVRAETLAVALTLLTENGHPPPVRPPEIVKEPEWMIDLFSGELIETSNKLITYYQEV